ncbi:MAG: hypothetical protein PGN13_07575 [Patulibacter minatonensis]
MATVRIEETVALLAAVGLGLQWWARSASREAGHIATGKLPTASDAARRVLDGAGLRAVPVLHAERRRLDAFRGERVMVRSGAVRLITADADRRTLAGVVGAARLAARAAVLSHTSVRLLWWTLRTIGRIAGSVAVACAMLLVVGIGGDPLRAAATVALTAALAGLLAGAATELAVRRRLRAALPALVPAALAADAHRLALVGTLGASAAAALPGPPTPRWPLILPGGAAAGPDSGAGSWGGHHASGSDGSGHGGSGHGGCGGGGAW